MLFLVCTVRRETLTQFQILPVGRFSKNVLSRCNAEIDLSDACPKSRSNALVKMFSVFTESKLIRCDWTSRVSH